MNLRTSTSRLGRDVHVVVSGSLDIASAPQLRETLRVAIDGGGQIVVDLEAVDFIDSSALGVLVGGLRRAREGGGDLRVLCSNREIVRVFRITGLEALFGLDALSSQEA